MNKKVIISILVIGNILLLVSFRKIKNNTVSLNKRLDQLSLKNDLLKEGFFHFFDYENLFKKEKLLFIKSDSTISIDNLITETNNVLLIIHAKSCNSCVIDEIKRFKAWKVKGVNKMIGISGLTSKEFEVFISTYLISDFSFQIDDSQLIEGLEYNPAFYCYVDSTHNYQYFYAPSNNLPELTFNYYRKISQLIDEKFYESIIDKKKLNQTFIKLDSSGYNFGKIKVGDTIRKKIKITNVGNYPLIISKIYKSCGCIKAEWSKEPVLPNKSRYIIVDFSEKEIKNFYKTLRIYGNFESNPMTIGLRGKVISKR